MMTTARSSGLKLITVEDSPAQVGEIGNINMKGDNEIKQQEEEECPLFMEGLPTDFSTNGQLAAIASLLQEEDDDSTKNPSRLRQELEEDHNWKQCYDTGSSSKLRNERRRSRRENPYQRPNPPKKKREATVGEANLFLKMWKL
mmetsp:Transcript_20989/g.29630  ORF Transcript_20989/g.29630 Transcript_20989/m.29630 type:complete len:144 (-) Transcript_20989:261-692(-)